MQNAQPRLPKRQPREEIVEENRDSGFWQRNGHFKRTIDIFLSLSACIAFAPLMLIIAICVKLTSAGPLIYKQSRVGRDGKNFTMYKFRTMYVDGCLLYTSPSPRDQRGSRMPSSA